MVGKYILWPSPLGHLGCICSVSADSFWNIIELYWFMWTVAYGMYMAVAMFEH